MTNYTTLNDKKIAYSRFGEGFPLVFIHGFCEDRSMWNDFIIPFQDKYSVITVDIGGFGESEQPETPNIKVMGEQVEAVLQVEKIEKCILIGHSMGGYTAMAFAEYFPQYLNGVVMFHTHPFSDTPEKKKVRDKGVEFIQTYGVEHFVAPLIPKLFGDNRQLEIRPVIDKLIKTAINYSSEAIIGGLIAMKNRPDRSSILENINCPVQFIIGKLDGAVSWEQSMKQTSIPNISDIQILEGVGHMGMFEATKQTQKMILDFVNFCIKSDEK
jgi:pimeloyl-ACP methyl ester carboxylesterase